MNTPDIAKVNQELIEGRKNLNVCAPVMGNALLFKNRLPKIIWGALIESIENSLDALSNVTQIQDADGVTFPGAIVPQTSESAALVHARKNVEVCAPILEKAFEGKYKLPNGVFNKVSRALNNSLAIISTVGEALDNLGDTDFDADVDDYDDADYEAQGHR